MLCVNMNSALVKAAHTHTTPKHYHKCTGGVSNQPHTCQTPARNGETDGLRATYVRWPRRHRRCCRCHRRRRRGRRRRNITVIVRLLFVSVYCAAAVDCNSLSTPTRTHLCDLCHTASQRRRVAQTHVWVCGSTRAVIHRLSTVLNTILYCGGMQ